MATGIKSIPMQFQSDRPSGEGRRLSSPEGFATRNSVESRKTLVEALHLRKSYGSHLAVKDVSFSIQSGEVLGLLGPNGAGKSTTMFMLARLVAPTGGEVFLNGHKYDGRSLDQRRLIGIVPQEYAIYEELSAIGNLTFFGKLYGLGRKTLKSRCEEVLDEVGLTGSAHRLAGQYSGGMKRRLNFGIALMHKPPILILDEPTLGVDPQSRSLLMDCVRRQTAEGGCVIYASHHMEEVQTICQRVVILDQGQVIANDSIHRLLAGVVADLFLYVDRSAGIGNELGDLARVGTGSNEEPVVIVSGDKKLTLDHVDNSTLPNDLEIIATDIAPEALDLGWRLEATLCKLKKLGIQVLSVETQQSNLERLFLQLTGKRLRD